MGIDTLLTLGEGNRDFARRRFQNDVIVEEFMEILNEVVD